MWGLDRPICLAEAAAPSDSLFLGRHVQIYLLTYKRLQMGGRVVQHLVNINNFATSVALVEACTLLSASLVHAVLSYSNSSMVLDGWTIKRPDLTWNDLGEVRWQSKTKSCKRK